MTIEEAIERFTHNAEYERTHGSLQGCLEFRQLAEWLKELRAYRKMYRKEHEDDFLRTESDRLATAMDEIGEMIEDFEMGRRSKEVTMYKVHEIIDKHRKVEE